MKHIKILDKEFEISIPYSKIDEAITKIADKMNKELADKDPLFVTILNGSFMFSADLLKKLEFACQITFLKLASYEGTNSTGVVKKLIGFNEEIKGRTVVVIEDIIDTGNTIGNIKDQIMEMEPSELQFATLLFKPEACKKDVKIDYLGLEIPNDFIVGYGLDYEGYGRNLKDIYTVINK